jgi:hypothetical protein
MSASTSSQPLAISRTSDVDRVRGCARISGLRVSRMQRRRAGRDALDFEIMTQSSTAARDGARALAQAGVPRNLWVLFSILVS